jgi:drug/metabolite transporter (DMT)-like permease
MIEGVVLALAASIFTASASITQRFAAAPAPGELAFSWRLIGYLSKRPVWFVGILCMIAGFVFQVAALRTSSLSLVQPLIATELLFVFGFLAVRSPRRVSGRDWIAACAMAVGLAAFLVVAHPTGGAQAATHVRWFEAATVVVIVASLFWLLARVRLRTGRRPSPSRQAAMLAVAAGVVFGFVAAVVKELSGQLAGGPYAVITNWSPYVLLISGAAAFFLVSNAFQAGPLAASQPGLTVVDPLVASFLGVYLFHDHVRHDPLDVLGEVVALVVLVAGVVMLSRSPLVDGEPAERTAVAPPALEASAPTFEAPAAASDVTSTTERIPPSVGVRTGGQTDPGRRAGSWGHVLHSSPSGPAPGHGRGDHLGSGPPG